MKYENKFKLLQEKAERFKETLEEEKRNIEEAKKDVLSEESIVAMYSAIFRMVEREFQSILDDYYELNLTLQEDFNTLVQEYSGLKESYESIATKVEELEIGLYLVRGKLQDLKSDVEKLIKTENLNSIVGEYILEMIKSIEKMLGGKDETEFGDDETRDINFSDSDLVSASSV